MSTLPTRKRDQVAIHPDTSMGRVRLTVSDVDRSQAFYERAIGLRPTELEDGAVALGVDGEPPLIELRGDPTAPSLDPRAPGLFHLAILLPDRAELAMALARLAQARVPLSGASDHLVSEALYLSDPDGNGIEIYRDRPRDEWHFRDGDLQMATLPLDLDSLIGELSGRTEVTPLAPGGTRMGHVHLQVSDLDEAERFYNGALGFDVMVRGYPGALFVSAGGYHHHLGLNTWHSAGSPPAAPGAIGLGSFEIVLPNAEELDRVLARARAAGIETHDRPDGSLVHDPFGNGVLLRAR
jgi:catechol 2,3-dioxygenase